MNPLRCRCILDSLRLKFSRLFTDMVMRCKIYRRVDSWFKIIGQSVPMLDGTDKKL